MGVCQTIAGNIIGRDNKNGGHQLGIGHDVSPTLNTIDRHAVAYSMGHDERSAQFTPNKTDPLTASDYKQPPIVNDGFYTRQSISEFKQTGTASALKARDYKDYTDVVTANKEVRRLTPTECERLQGIPDGYTDIKFKGKPAPDSRRYKALGNGMAQPCADYVIRRIQEVNDSGQTERLGTCRDDRR